jgi:hypothetical protein
MAWLSDGHPRAYLKGVGQGCDIALAAETSVTIDIAVLIFSAICCILEAPRVT